MTTRREKAIRRAFYKFRGVHRRLYIFEEHGREWVEELPTGGQWSVNDVEGGGFAFECVTEPEEV